MRKITIIRPSRFVGSAMPCSVVIDDGEYSVLNNGQTKTFEIPDGSHRMQIIASPLVNIGHSVYKSDVVFIDETDGNSAFELMIKMGFQLKLSLERVQ